MCSNMRDGQNCGGRTKKNRIMAQPFRDMLGRRFAAGCLAAALSLGAPLSALAIPPYDHIPEECSEETWARMQDGLVEWDEIGDLVQYYNPTYTKAFDAADGSIIGLEGAYSTVVKDMQGTLETVDKTLDDLYEQQKKLMRLPAGTVLPDGSSKEAALLKLGEGIQQAKAGRRTASDQIRNSADSIKRATKSLERQFLPVKKQLTQAMQAAVLGYEQLKVQETMVKAQVTLYETALSTQENLKARGMATEADVLSAQNDLLSAKQSLSQIQNGMESVRRSVGLQLGWDGVTLPELGPSPEPDAAFVDTTNPDADKTAAIMHNSEVRDAAKPESKSSFGLEIRDRTENEKTGLLVAKMDSLYADMKEKKALYEAAQTSLERAELTKASAEQKYQLGMLGRAEYEGQMLAYTSYQAAYELAKLNLFQSINTYQWAVDGYVTID